MRALGGLIGVTALGCGRIGFSASSAPDDSASDGPSDAAAVCAKLFCDDFADNSLSRWGGTDGAAGSVTVSPMGRTGLSLHAVGAIGETIAAVHADVFTTEPERWVRAYVFAPSGFVLDDEVVSLSDPDEAHEVVFSLFDDATDVHTHGFTPDLTDGTDTTPVPRDVWSCYEFHVVIESAGLIELYRDGALLDSLTADTQSQSSRLLIGITSKPVSGASEMFVDDIVADGARIGCL